MKRLFAFVVCGLALSAAVRANPYWISYDASTGVFPEEDGWQRLAYGGGAQRWFEDGSLVLDDGGASGIIDDYGRQGPLDPGPGEVFSIQWRLRVDEGEYFDPAVIVTSYGHGALDLAYTRGEIYSVLEDVWIPIAPGVFHDYMVTTSDMLAFQLTVDGDLAYAGRFVGPYWASGVTWGDTAYGASSISRWEYVRFGVVPEPSAAALFGLAVLAVISTRARRAWRNML
jgi:hypothetical protein